MNGRTLRLIGFLLALVLAVGCLCQVAVEQLWFTEVGYVEVFWLRLATQTGIWAIVSLLSAAFLLGNLAIARRLQYPRALAPGSALLERQPNTVPQRLPFLKTQPLVDRLSDRQGPIPETQPLPLRWLLPIVLGLLLLIGLFLLQQMQATIAAWRTLTQPNGLPALPERLHIGAIGQVGQQVFAAGAVTPVAYLVIGLAIAGAFVSLLYPIILLNAIAIVESLGMAFILSAQWGRVLQFFQAVPFPSADPLFGTNISFYIFSLPLWQLLAFWLINLFLYGFLAVLLIYLLSGKSLSQGFFTGFSWGQMQHLSALSGCLMVSLCLHYGISRYELLYSTRGVTYGASYTDVTVLLPIDTLLSLVAGAIAVVLFWQAARQRPADRKQAQAIQDVEGRNATQRRAYKTRTLPHKQRFPFFSLPLSLPYPVLLLGSYCAIALITSNVLPTVVQRLIVQPNELTREATYIRRSIALTRAAFALDKIEIQPFDPQGTLTLGELLDRQQLVSNIRLWDTRPLLQTNRQLQQIRPYYRFFDADVDRYTFESKTIEDKQTAANSVSAKQQVLIAARELDYTAVPSEAKTWINEHLVYTHGYGFTLSPVNRVAAGGLPYYYVKDIAPDAATSNGNLTASDAAIRNRIPTANPRLYYGELANTYVMTGTRVPELDYPSGSDNVYNSYDGAGGVGIGSWWRRWLLAGYLKDWQMLLTKNFTPQSRLLFRRNINQRIQAIAPFLTYDHDPYLVVAKVDQEPLINGTEAQKRKGSTQNYLYWMVDAYTTSDRYPYSEPSQLKPVNGTQTTSNGVPFNYIRNSVKIVIDAYNGSVDFFVTDPTDPIIQAWSALFPKLFKPLSQMPAALREHIRYPTDLFSIQSERLMTYHMMDPQVFYNREDLWQVPTEIYCNQPQLVEPYHLITKLTIGKDEEFVLLLPFTPNQRTNLTAWLAARSDGDAYGKALLYVFPKQQLVYGTEQIEARINQDPVISQQISLWNRAGSRAIQGNLLVIPIDQSLLYVEPLYLEAEQNSLPTLVRVIVAYENRIAMAETLEAALSAVFQSQKTTTPAIVRPVE